MNKQEIFDKVWERSITKKLPASFDPTSEAGCVYMPPSGNLKEGCHFGCLLTPEQYHPSMECNNVYGVRGHANKDKLNEEIKLFINQLDKDGLLQFCSNLQQIHDNHAVDLFKAGYLDNHEEFTIRVERDLRSVANHHGLTIPEA